MELIVRWFLLGVLLLFGGYSSTTITAQQAEERAVENMAAFTKLLGYVSLFYPGDIAAETDWDAFAIRHIEAVETAEDAEALAQILRDLFTPYAPTIQVYVTGDQPEALELPEATDTVTQWVRPGVVDFQARTGDLVVPERIQITLVDGELPETIDYDIIGSDIPIQLPVNSPKNHYETQLSSGVSASIPLSLYIDSEGTLPQIETPAGSDEPLTLAITSRAARLGSIAITWNRFQHLYSYWDVLDELGIDWDAALREALVTVGTSEDPLVFHDALKRMTAYLNDGHTNVYSTVDSLGLNRSISHTLPFKWEVIEGQLAVVELAEDYDGDIQLGDVITAIEGRPTAVILAEIDALTSPVGQAGWYFQLPQLAAGGIGNVELTVQPIDGGDSYSTTVKRSQQINPNEESYYHRETRPATVAWLSPGILYVDLTRLEVLQFGLLIPVMAGAEGLVFDMRGYPNGNHPILVLNHLSDEARSTAPFLIPIFTQPDHQDVVYADVTGEWITPQKPRFTDNVAWIVNANGNVSYAESIMGIVEGYGIGEIVGTRTAGANGNVARLTLPNGFVISYTSLKVTKFDGSPLFTVGVTPTIEVDRTLEGVAAGRDELLEAAFETVGGETLEIEPLTVEESETFDINNIVLLPHTDTEQGFSTVVPEGWTAMGASTFALGNRGEAMLVIERNPDDTTTFDLLIEGSQEDAGDAEIQRLDSIEAGELTWSLYQYSNGQMTTVIAAAEVEGALYAVALLTTGAQRDTLFEGVLLPALEAFEIEGE